MNKARFLNSICFYVIVLFSASAKSSIITFNVESDFLSVAPIVSTENFDGFSAGQFWSVNDIIIDSVHYNTTYCLPEPPSECWAISTSGAVTEPNSLVSNNIADNTITFGTGNYVDAFGFWFTGFGVSSEIPPTTGDWIITIKEIDGSAHDIRINGGQDTTEYFGFVSDIGISEVLVVDDPSDSGGGNWWYDNVSRSQIKVVPIPPALWLFGSGLLGLIWIARKKADLG